MASPKLIDTDGLTVFKDECNKAYLPKVTLSAVATSGSYTDLSNKPTIPTVPTALKNPNALTFTGAVTGSYDGSAAKSVNIPAAQNLTPYMKKTADSDLSMGDNKLVFPTGTISAGLLGGSRHVLIIDASNSEGVNIKAHSVLVNGFTIATKTDLSGKLDKTDTAAAAIKATQDGAGNVIATTYIKTVNNLKPDVSGNVNISGGTGGNITVDSALSSTSTNAIQNRVVQQEFTSVRSAIPTKVSQLTNDSGYLTQHQSLDGYVKTVNNTAPDSNGNVTIAISGGGGSGDYLPLTGGTVTGGIIATNFQTGTGAANYFQCRKFRGEGDANSYYHAIDFGYSGHDSVDFYEYDPNWNFYKCLTGTKSGAVLVGNINGNGWNGGARLTGAPTAPTASVGTNTTQIATTAFVQAAIPTNVSSFTNDVGYIKSVNNIKPDSNGNVNISTSSGGGGGVSTSVANTWTAQQNFQRLKFNFESFATSRIGGTYDSPATSVATYNVTGALTLDMSTLAGMISNGDTSIFTAYIASNGSYALSITNAGTLKHAGSAADLAITASGLLLNIFLTKNASGVVTSIAQATKLS